MGQKFDRATAPADPGRVADTIVAQFSGKMFTLGADFPNGARPRALAPRDIRTLRARGLGFVEISILLALADRTEKSVTKLFRMRQAGIGWGELARRLGLKDPGSIVESVKATEKGVLQVATDGLPVRREGCDE